MKDYWKEAELKKHWLQEGVEKAIEDNKENWKRMKEKPLHLES